MNEERIEQLAQTIEQAKQVDAKESLYISDLYVDHLATDKAPDAFNMEWFHAKERYGCGTAGCIAGWCVGIYAHTDGLSHDGRYIRATSELLGIPMDVANALCDPGDVLDLVDITPEEAAGALRHLIGFADKDPDEWGFDPEDYHAIIDKLWHHAEGQ